MFRDLLSSLGACSSGIARVAFAVRGREWLGTSGFFRRLARGIAWWRTSAR